MSLTNEEREEIVGMLRGIASHLDICDPQAFACYEGQLEKAVAALTREEPDVVQPGMWTHADDDGPMTIERIRKLLIAQAAREGDDGSSAWAERCHRAADALAVTQPTLCSACRGADRVHCPEEHAKANAEGVELCPLCMPIEQVRAELARDGIDTQPIKDYVHAKLAELRFGGERMEDRRKKLTAPIDQPISQAIDLAPAACQCRELLQRWLVEWQTGLLPRRELIEDVRAALAQPCAAPGDAEWELIEEVRVTVTDSAGAILHERPAVHDFEPGDRVRVYRRREKGGGAK